VAQRPHSELSTLGAEGRQTLGWTTNRRGEVVRPERDLLPADGDPDHRDLRRHRSLLCVGRLTTGWLVASAPCGAVGSGHRHEGARPTGRGLNRTDARPGAHRSRWPGRRKADAGTTPQRTRPRFVIAAAGVTLAAGRETAHRRPRHRASPDADRRQSRPRRRRWSPAEADGCAVGGGSPNLRPSASATQRVPAATTIARQRRSPKRATHSSPCWALVSSAITAQSTGRRIASTDPADKPVT